MPSSGKIRCQWCGDDPHYIHYHDTEWGVPVRDDRTLFEMLILEGAHAADQRLVAFPESVDRPGRGHRQPAAAA